MKLTEFTFFKDTPLTDFQNTILFDSNNERDSFFLDQDHYDKIEEKTPFNFIKDRLTISTSIPYEKFQGINYCTFLSDFEPDTRYYCYVIKTEYMNDGNTKAYLLIDGVMTFCQGDVLNGLTNLKIDRQHLPLSEYNNYAYYLKNNDDVLKTHTKNYFETITKSFKDFLVVIQSTADLTVKFGTEDDPKVKTSSGITFDKITSPVNLYVVELNNFNSLMKALSPFPWIAQNIKSVIMIPKEFIATDSYLKVSMSEGDFDQLYEFKNGERNKAVSNLFDLTFRPSQLYELFDLDMRDDKHLLRSEYTTTEIYSWDGQSLLIDNGLLNEKTGLQFDSKNVIGYKNQFSFFIQDYKTQKTNDSYNYMEGSFLNDSIVFSNFDEIPILVDNYNLSLAQNANKRGLAESKLLSNRLASVKDPNADIKDRFMNATSLLTNFSPTNLFGKFNDEYEFYRTQRAEQADLALTMPTITSQTNGNAFQVANDIFGVTVKFSAPNVEEWKKIKKYYKLFGYEINDDNRLLSNVRSMTIANYVKFSGNWTIKGVDIAIIEQIKAQFENGVRLWHNNGTDNPMKQSILENKMR